MAVPFAVFTRCFLLCNWRNIPLELGNNWIGTIRECTLSPSLFLCFFWILLVLCLIGSASIGKKGHFSALPLMESDASCSECAGSAMSIKFNKLPIYHLRILQPRALRFLSSFPSSVQRIITFIVPRLFVSALPPFHRCFPLAVAGCFLLRRFFSILIWHRER